MSTETEFKIKVESFAPIRKRLLELEAKKESRVFECNALFDDSKRSLIKKDCLLRLRQDKKTKITYKGPRHSNDLKSREEIEFEVEDIAKAEVLLNRLGFKKTLIYEKTRETWRHKNVEVVLDEMPFGTFIEIEGNSKAIVLLAKKLGFSEKEFITKTYFELAKEKGIKGNIVFKKR
ncbi:MAG: class IV adenylate cyclase [Candidatus Aenigmarchaeota archaeon]|nr:class IV adenylate cyclase [Candidatus Aenigmarchaeota archaeon]